MFNCSLGFSFGKRCKSIITKIQFVRHLILVETGRLAGGFTFEKEIFVQRLPLNSPWWIGLWSFWVCPKTVWAFSELHLVWWAIGPAVSSAISLQLTPDLFSHDMNRSTCKVQSRVENVWISNEDFLGRQVFLWQDYTAALMPFPVALPPVCHNIAPNITIHLNDPWCGQMVTYACGQVTVALDKCFFCNAILYPLLSDMKQTGM